MILNESVLCSAKDFKHTTQCFKEKRVSGFYIWYQSNVPTDKNKTYDFERLRQTGMYFLVLYAWHEIMVTLYFWKAYGCFQNILKAYIVKSCILKLRLLMMQGYGKLWNERCKDIMGFLWWLVKFRGRNFYKKGRIVTSQFSKWFMRNIKYRYIRNDNCSKVQVG